MGKGVHFAGPVYSGGVPLSGHNFHGWWGNDVWYIDYDNGNNGNEGKSPTEAKKDLAEVLAVAGPGDTIYMRPRAFSITNELAGEITPASGTNWTIPYTAEGLSIIGTAPGHGEAGAFYTYLKGHASATTDAAVLKVDAPFVNLENLSFHRGVATTAEVWFYHYGDTANYGFAGSLYNCLFRLASGASSTARYGLKLDGGFWHDVRNCYFDRCLSGIRIESNWQEPDNIHIERCVFLGQTSERCCDIIITACDNIDIHECRFPNTTPTAAGTGTGYYIHAVTASTGQVSDCMFGVDHATTGLGATTLNGIIVTDSYGGDTLRTQ